ncbi:hypothetical protein G1E_35865 [Pseudomonas sp. TJI-51]|jgi:hypothetical protein|nr:hypothetical protein G1E_35865 [Pseudomonas sp. TJI-51]
MTTESFTLRLIQFLFRSVLGRSVVGLQPEGTAGIELHVCDLDIPEDTSFTPLQLEGLAQCKHQRCKDPHRFVLFIPPVTKVASLAIHVSMARV